MCSLKSLKSLPAPPITLMQVCLTEKERFTDEVDIEDDGTLSTKRWKKQKNEFDINLMPDMKELRECSDGEQHMKNDVVASNMCGKGRVRPVPSLAW
ncbi:hypothetical protein Tco_0267039 [Tanacetum coccineum]